MNSACIVHVFKNIKNKSHGTIHTFKNYFTTVFLDFSFSNNKFNPNGPYVYTLINNNLNFSYPTLIHTQPKPTLIIPKLLKPDFFTLNFFFIYFFISNKIY